MEKKTEIIGYKMIDGNENLQQIAEIDRNLVAIFEKYGLGSYFKTVNLNKIGKFLKVNTLLKSRNINQENFIALLNETLSENNAKDIPSIKQDNLHFSAMLPCGLRNPFKEYFESIVQDNSGQLGYLNYLIEGNVNHELSYYPLLDSIEDIDELPDVILASDVNNFFHKPFMERFIRKGIFSAYNPYVINNYLGECGYADNENNFTMFTANMLVMVVDKKKLGGHPLPEKWGDLLDDAFSNNIVMRGEGDFFCNAVMLPFYKDYGIDAIKKMAHNIYSGMHPAEMVKQAGANGDKGKAVYIMPYFFAQRVKKSSVEIIWPSDGAIASPVFLLVKKGKAEQHRSLLDLLTGKDMGRVLIDRHFPSLHPELSNEVFPTPVKWLGWDFIYNTDIAKVKDEITEEFMKIWKSKK